MKKQFKQSLSDIQQQQHIKNVSGELNRARSITVGTCFGGTTEIMMRGLDGSVLWCAMQPVEVVELINQLAANVGCHIHIQPRRDFASWRDWKYTEEELAHYRGVQHTPGVGHSPHVNDMAPHQSKGQNLPAPEQQPGLQPALMARSNENEQTLATQKTVGRKRTKRAAAAA
jgi:hypothetical protein